MFGQSPNLRYGDVTGSLGGYLNGGTGLAGMAGQITPQATQTLGSQFAGGPSRLAGNYGINPGNMAPQFGQAGGLDATGAFNRMLSGQPDYQGLQGAIDSANAPILRQFEQDILPGLNERATFLNNPTGGYKTLNRVLPEIGERMSMNAQALTNQERLRALDSQERAAATIGQGGLASYGLGLDAASRQAGLNLQADTTSGQFADRFRADALNFGSLAGQLQGQTGQQGLAAAGMYPSIYQMGMEGNSLGMEEAAWRRGLAEDSLAAEQDRFNYLRDQPFNQVGWLSSLISPGAGLGGTVNTTGRQPGGSRAAGALGGALAGAQMGSSFGPWGTAIGGILGGAGGYFL